MIRSAAPVDRHHNQGIHAVQMLHVTAGVGELQSQQEDHLLRSFGVHGAAPHTCTTQRARPKSWAAVEQAISRVDRQILYSPYHMFTQSLWRTVII